MTSISEPGARRERPRRRLWPVVWRWRRHLVALAALSVVVLAGLVGAAGRVVGGSGRSVPRPSPVAVHAAAGAPREQASASTSTAGVPALPSGATGQSARIEETGSLTLVVPGARIQSDLGRLSAVASGAGGFVSDTQAQSAGAGGPAQGLITLQVPEEAFAAVVSEVQGMGRVTGLTTKATDVTGQYVDLQARITALQDSRQQYLTILSQATSISDILSVQEQLDQLQTQIEQLQGQLQVLDSETTYATLTVTLTPVAVPVTTPPTGLAGAWHAALSGFAAGLDGLVRISGPLVFALLLLGVLVVVARWGQRWRRVGRAVTPQPTAGSTG